MVRPRQQLAPVQFEVLDEPLEPLIGLGEKAQDFLRPERLRDERNIAQETRVSTGKWLQPLDEAFFVAGAGENEALPAVF